MSSKVYTNGLTSRKINKKGMWSLPVRINHARKMMMTPERAKNVYSLHIESPLECLEFQMEYDSEDEGFYMIWAMNWKTGRKILKRLNLVEVEDLNGKILDAYAAGGSCEVKGFVV